MREGTQQPAAASSDWPGPKDGRAEWRRSWPVVLSAFLGIGFGALPFYSAGVFLEPISVETGWSRTQVSLGLTIVSAVTVLGAPLVGLLVDNLGPRRIALTGILAYSVVVWLIALVADSIWLWWAAWLAIGFAHVLVMPTVWTTAVAGRFHVTRGLAMAAVLTGTGLTAALAPLIADQLLQYVGWRLAYPVLLSVSALAVAAVSAIFFFGPKDLMRVPGHDMTSVAAQTGATLRAGLLSRRYWQLTLASFLVAVPSLGLVMHFVPMVRAGGLPAHDATGMAAAVGVFMIIGRLATGYLLDRVDGRVVGGLSFALPIISCGMLLAYDGSAASALPIAIIIGLAAGSEADVSAYLLSRHLGLRSFGTLYGTLVGMLVLATGLAPLGASFAFDQTGSYRIYYLLGALVCFTAVVLVVSLGRYPNADTDRTPDKAALPSSGTM